MKGWLDNFGKADNANNSEVNLPEGFVGLAYDTKGRNYSPAWGGQFKQGGIIPIAQNGVSEYMEKKKWEEKDKNIAKTYDLPEVVVSAPIMTKYNDPDKLTGYPQYIPKSGDNKDIPGWDMAEFYKSWVSSPEYERRMRNTGYYEDVPGGAIYRKEGSTIRPQMRDWLVNARESRMASLEGTQDPGFVTIEPATYRGLPASVYSPLGISIHPHHTRTPEIYQNVLAHEIAHAIDTPSTFENELIKNTMLQDDAFYDQPQFHIGRNPLTGNLISDEKSRMREGMATYVRNDPQEFKSDLNALRYLMFDKGIYDIRKGKEFTKEDLERAKEVLKGNESLERSLDAAGESGFIKLMNVIAKGKEDVTPVAMGGMSIPGSVGFTYARVAGAAPSKGKYAKKTMASAQNGKEMKFYQNGLDWKPKSMQDGGITKDNLGYWNPDNWGKPVEIGSNNITMEGVYEPLLGVSDTGDTKLMQPGKNYKFKGKKVTEYPVAQYGKGVPFRSAQNPTKNISNPLNLPSAVVPNIKPKASFEEQKRIAKLELDKYGYTSDQRKGYVKGKSEKAFRNIVPQGYGDLTTTLDRIERYEKNLGRNPNETVWYGAEDSPTGKPIYYDLPKRDDAFALYLGLPQKNKSFGISEYQPGDSKENKYYYKPNYLDDNLKNRLLASYFGNVEDGKNTYIANERLDAFRQKTDSLRRAGVPDENPIYAKWIVDNPLGDFKMSKGKDEKGHYISIYDVWDLNPFKQGEGASSNAAAATLKAFAKMKGVDVDDETEMSNLFGAGKPFEIYDRIYYDPKTKKVIPQKRNGGGVGINQLDAQPMKKLNQLLNFTNNPDKDNWLDKYN